MIRKLLPLSILMLALSMTIVACGASKHSPRKCDGKKGQKTPMGRI